MKNTQISFVRHGEVHNPKQIYYGRLPRFRLSNNGRSQALCAAKILESGGVTAVYHSPLLRARQTANIIAKHLQLPTHQTSQVLEVYTPYDGQPLKTMAMREWDFYSDTQPPYEQPADIAARMAKFTQIMRRKHAGQHIVAVSHADPIAFAALWATGQPITINGRKHLTQAGLPTDYPDHASILTLTFEEGGGKRPFQTQYQPSHPQQK